MDGKKPAEEMEELVERIVGKVAGYLRAKLKAVPMDELNSVEVDFSSVVSPEMLERVLEVSEPLEIARLGFSAEVRIPNYDRVDEHLADILRNLSLPFFDNTIWRGISSHFRFEPPTMRVFLRLLPLLGGTPLRIRRNIYGVGNSKGEGYRVGIGFHYRMPALEATARLLRLVRVLKGLSEDELLRLEGLPDSELLRRLEFEGLLSQLMNSK